MESESCTFDPRLITYARHRTFYRLAHQISLNIVAAQAMIHPARFGFWATLIDLQTIHSQNSLDFQTQAFAPSNGSVNNCP